MKIILVSTLFSISSFLSAQDFVQDVSSSVLTKPADSIIETDTILTSKNMDHRGRVIYNEDPRFELLLKDYISTKEIQGYRIQLFSGRSRWDAIKVKSDFLSKHENHPIYLSYQQPNFKLRAGNFRDKLEASKHLKTYKIDFPTAFIVQEGIEISPRE